ncbi:hypothetical protein BZG36_03361 [Bifiguratus adelaidae]|uniref:Major facilitator superfamily (MFS) profile domain-containing protein n=1 Tax=Bifiguratus adelaidae TaxID=1938954 RepID=A0A261XXK5_9FUNG|nr:hypothetical protein BZG36_03361 [Bifiguratus adelaidae]
MESREHPTEIATSDQNSLADASTVGAEGTPSVHAAEKDALPVTEPLTFPEGGLDAWLCCLAASVSMFCGFGLTNAWGVFQTYYEEKLLTQYDPSTIAWIGSFQLFGMFAGAGLAGPVFDRHGARHLMMWSSLAYIIGIMLSSISTEYYQLFLTQGLIQGFAGGALFGTGMVATNHWFREKRGIATGIVAAGSSLGGVVWPIALNAMLNGSTFGFGWTVRIVGFIDLGLLIVCCILVKGRLPRRDKIYFYDRDLFRNRVFLTYIAALFLCFLGLYIPFFFITVDAINKGISVSYAFYLITIINASSAFGRIIPGLIADKFGRLNVLFLAAAMSALLNFLWITSSNVWEITLFAVAFGFASGSCISLGSAAVGQLCPHPTKIGYYFSVALILCALGGLFGSPIGGALVDAHGGYDRAKIFGGCVGIAGVMLMALTRVFLEPRFFAKV